jgi:hypothetical protein
MSARGVCFVLKEACLQRVSRLMACRVTMHCCAPPRIVVCAMRASRQGWILIGAIGCVQQGVVAVGVGVGVITFGTGRIPGVLLRVTWRYSCGMVHNVHLAVGLRVSMTGGTSVIQGIGIMGESSITLCSVSRASCWRSAITLCCSKIGGG